jgi:addiction module HigA family antidote
MAMRTPAYPGEFIRSVYLELFGMSVRTLVENIGVALSTLNRVVSGKSKISPEMALPCQSAGALPGEMGGYAGPLRPLAGQAAHRPR